MRFLHPCVVRNQNHGQAVPAREKAMQAHGSRAAIGIIGIDEHDHIGSKIDQGNNMIADAMFFARRRRAQTDCRPQFFVNGEVEDAPAANAGILNSIGNAQVPQRIHQAARTACAGMAFGESVQRFEAVMASQRLQRTPAAASRRTILYPAVKGNVDFRVRYRRDKQQRNERNAIQGSKHGKILFPRSEDRMEMQAAGCVSRV